MERATEGIVLDIAAGAMNDGPGIRTTVFLKGCPLCCAWCHNPESQQFEPETGRKPDGSIVRYGRRMKVSEVMEIVCRDRVFYQKSGGGVTISGGEPLTQPAFTKALIDACWEEKIPVCLDTSGYGSGQLLEEAAGKAALILFDYKQTGEEKHREHTGVSSLPILENLKRLNRMKKEVWLRCPIVPGFQDNDRHFAAIARLEREYPCISRVELMPYHTLGRHKYAELGRTEPTSGLAAVDEKTKETYQRRLAYFEKMGDRIQTGL